MIYTYVQIVVKVYTKYLPKISQLDECPWYEIKPSDGEAPGTRVVAPNRVLRMGQIELFDI